MTLTVATYQQPGQLALPNGSYTPTRQRSQQGLSVMVHAPKKTGKSSFGDSGPRPVLVLDVENAAFWTPSRKIYWNPARETCPVADGSWDTCVVIIQTYKELYDLLKFLQAGQHPFNSISMDSVTEIQQRIMFELVGTKKMMQDDWGALLRNVNALIRGYRDLITHPTRPVWSVCYVAGTHFDQRRNQWRPLVQGASQDYLPYVPDLLGWMEIMPDGSRHLWTGPSPYHETGERLWGRLPLDMQVGYPGVVPGWTLTNMVEHLLASQ